MITELPVVVPPPEEDEEPDPATGHPMRAVTRAVAFEPTGWTRERRAQVVELFDRLADEWHTRDAPGRDAPLIDALDRGLAAAAMAAEAPALRAAVAAATTTEVPVVVPGRPPPAPAEPVTGAPVAEADHDVPTADDVLASFAAERNQAATFAPAIDADDLFGSAAEHAALVGRSMLRTCIDVGGAIGLAAVALADRFPTVVTLDLSYEMLRRAPAAPALRVQADASSLPVADGGADVLVLANMFLFPAEVDRALAPDGVLVWVSSRGPDTPIYLPADDVAAALPGSWDSVSSRAGRGTWSVHWRTPR